MYIVVKLSEQIGNNLIRINCRSVSGDLDDILHHYDTLHHSHVTHHVTKRSADGRDGKTKDISFTVLDRYRTLLTDILTLVIKA